MLFVEYLKQNFALLLLVGALAILVKTTVHFSKNFEKRIFILLGQIIALSVVQSIEQYFGNLTTYSIWRSILSATQYSLTTAIMAQVIYTFSRRVKLWIYIPAAINTIFCFISVFTGVVFNFTKDTNVFLRGLLGYLPFIVCGLYLVLLVFILVKHSNRRLNELIPIGFMVFCACATIILPLFWPGFDRWFCTTIAIAVFVFFVFETHQVTKKDPLTGLLNRQSYYSDLETLKDNITALISLDMDGLKKTNDTYGHTEGDKALCTLAYCFLRATRSGQNVYRVGGDEFTIICTRTSKIEVERLVESIHKFVSETKYSCSVGYSYVEEGKSPDEMFKEADALMYSEKERHHREMQI